MPHSNNQENKIEGMYYCVQAFISLPLISRIPAPHCFAGFSSKTMVKTSESDYSWSLASKSSQEVQQNHTEVHLSLQTHTTPCKYTNTYAVKDTHTHTHKYEYRYA